MRKILLTLCVLVSSGCCIYIAGWFLNGQVNRHADRELAGQFHQAPLSSPVPGAQQNEPAPKEPGLDEHNQKKPDPFEELKKINPDIVGWITIPGTVIDYPIVQSVDNEYYLTRDFFGEFSKRGAVFMDYRCVPGSVNKIIYGHHMKDGTMFHDLKKYNDPIFREKILLYTFPGEAETYQVVEVWQWDGTNELQESFYEHIGNLSDRYGGEPLLSLATCDYASSDARLVVVAQKVERRSKSEPPCPDSTVLTFWELLN